MKIYHRYIAVRLYWGWLLVGLILVALFSIMELVGQVDDLGEGRYQLQDAVMYVVYTLPARILSLAAVISLLGSIVALGTLANSGELLAMRACGLSVPRIARVALGAGSVIMLGALLLGQFVAPPLEQQAKINRKLALSEVGTLLPSGGFWARGENRYINVGSSSPEGELADVSIFEFDEQGKPTGFVTASKAKIDRDGSWVCLDARQVTFLEQGAVDRVSPMLTFEVFLNPRQIDALASIPAMLSPSALYRQIGSMREKGQNPDQYVLALWQKMTLPLKVGALIFFSLPFVFGRAREASPGRRVTLGSIVGIAYYYFDQALGYTGLLVGLHPAFTTLLPLAIISLISTWLLLRVP
jgi:lipopolysaccharide export system permease protein